MANIIRTIQGQNIMPKGKIEEKAKYVSGTDGEKMSKSRGNFINLFETDKKLRKQVMTIETDSTPLEEPKDPETCNVFAIYKLVAGKEATAKMRENYLGGNYGYGHAKQALFELLVEKYATQRERYTYYMEHRDELDAALVKGATKAKIVADGVLQRVRTKLGY